MQKKIDKKLYQQAQKYYQQWNETEFTERIKNAGKLSPSDAFLQYVSLVEFCWKLCPRQSDSQRNLKLAALDLYYERVKKLEAWRHSNGKKS